MTAFSVKRKKVDLKLNHYYSCDPTCMVVALYPSAVLESKHVYCTVELKGELTRGQVVIDWRGKLKKSANVELILKIDKEIIKTNLENMLC